MSERDGDEDHHKATREFLAKLLEFHQKNGTPLRRIPTLGGRELDVYHLYKKVESLGGHDVVSQTRLWGEVARSFNLPASVTSASYAVRQHYIKLLERFEAYEKDPNYFDYVQPVTFTPKLPPPLLPWRTMVATPIPNGTTPYAPVTNDQRVGFDRLTRSLLSGYPNEVDLTFNVLTVMTFESPGALSSTELCRVLDLMLAHVAVFPSSQLHDDLGLESLYHECWHPPDSGADFLKFWAVTSPEWVCAALLPHYCPISLHQHSGMFASHCDGTECEVESYRISQVATIFSNLVLSPKFLPFLSGHAGTQRFLLLATSCSHPTIKSVAMDVLICMAPHLLSCPLSSPSFSLSSSCFSPWESKCLLELLVRSMLECLFAQDRDTILQSLEVLSQLSWEPPNQILLTLMHVEVSRRVFQLLLLPDVQLVLLCLDFLYSVTLSDSDPPPSAASGIVSLYRWCEVLVSLLTLDIKSFGEEALDKFHVANAGPSTAPSTTPYSPSASLLKILPTTSIPRRPTTTPPSKQKVTLNVAKTDKPFLNPGTKPGNSQTIRIGNMVIPVMSMTNLLSQGRLALSSAAQGISSAAASAAQGQNLITSSALAQGLLGLTGITSSSLASPLKVSSSVTIQLLQSLLSLSNLPGATPIVPTTKGAHASDSLGQQSITTPLLISKGAQGESLSHPPAVVAASKGSVGGQTSIAVDHNDTGGSGAMKRKVEVVPVGENNKPLSNLLRSYLAKNTSTSTTLTTSTSLTLPPTAPVTSSDVTPSHSKNSSRSPPSPTPSSLSSSSTSSLSSRVVMLEPFATRWLEGNYLECRGSYVSQLEMYSLYLLACTRAGSNNTLSNSEFNVLLRKVFVNALSTRIAVGYQSVNMVAGLAKKLSPSSSSTSSTQPQRDSLTVITPITRLTTPLTPIHTSTASSNLAPNASTQSIPVSAMAALSRVDYSTRSPLAVSSKAEKANAGSCLPGCGREDMDSGGGCVEGRTGDVSHGDGVNGVEDEEEEGKEDEEMDDSLHWAKRIKLMCDEGVSETTVWSTARPTVSRLPAAAVVMPSTLTAGVSRDMNSVSPPPSAMVSTALPTTSQPKAAALTMGTSLPSPSTVPAADASSRSNSISPLHPPSSVGELQNVGRVDSDLSRTHGIKPNLPAKNNHLLQVSCPQPSPDATPPRTPALHTPTSSLSNLTSSLPVSLSLSSLRTTKVASLSTPTPTIPSLSSSPNTVLSLEKESLSAKSSPSPAPSDLLSYTTSSAPVVPEVVNIADSKTCLWNKCNSLHSNWSSLLAHLSRAHLSCTSYPASCRWDGCHSNFNRQKLSLLSHLQACHCTDDHTYSPPNVQKTLGRLKAAPSHQTEVEDSILTKAVRLTAALVLRNLARQLPEARRRLKSYEHILCRVAFSASEASTAALHCLQVLDPDSY